MPFGFRAGSFFLPSPRSLAVPASLYFYVYSTSSRSLSHIYIAPCSLDRLISGERDLIMAPIRRYLRITKHSVLEVRVYLDNPALSNTWLLNSRDPVLPRVMETVRPLVLPKLREENENAKKKGKKRRGVRDVVEGGR